MPGETEVINVGLRRVGASRITSRTQPNSKSANVANDIYDEVRDRLLASHPWNFATLRIQLAKLTAAPEFEYDNAFGMPFDWLRTISVHNNDGGKSTFDYRVEFQDKQHVVVTSSDEVWLRYVHRVTDPNFMNPIFRDALELALARDFSIPLAASGTLYDKYEALAARVLAAARSHDALGSPPERRPAGSWVSVRGGGHHGVGHHHNH